MKKKILLSLLAIAILAALVPASLGAQAKKTLTFVMKNETNPAAFEQIFAAFKAKTGITVEIQALPSGEEFGRLMQTRFATKDYPDLFEMDPGTKQ